MRASSSSLLSLFAFVLLVAGAASAAAQPLDTRFEIGAHVVAASSEEFDERDVGVGVRAGWMPLSTLGLEAEVTQFPGDFPNGTAFSRGRLEGFFGATFGPRIGRMRAFARLRPGFLNYRAASDPIACIQIFPPPLACTLAGGRTVLAIDAGAGFDLSIGSRTFLRFDLGDRMLRFDGPVIDSDSELHEERFWTHELRLAAGAGLRF